MLFASLRSFAENVRFTAIRTEMDSCQVVGPRGLRRPLGDFSGNSRVAHSDRPQTAPAPWNLPALSPRPPQTDPKKHDERRYCVRRRRVISVPAYREALPSLTVLSRRSAGLGRGFGLLGVWFQDEG